MNNPSISLTHYRSFVDLDERGKILNNRSITMARNARNPSSNKKITIIHEAEREIYNDLTIKERDQREVQHEDNN